MSLEADIRSLASPDKDVQATARRTLIASGAAAVPPLMAHLRDEDSPIAWSATAWVLRQIGEPAAQPLIDVIASDASEEVRRRARWAFNGLKVAGPAGLAPAFTHADPRVRAAAARLVQNRDADGTASVFTGLLLDLLGDQDDDVRHSAVSALAAIGEPAADVLRGIRRAPSTGRRRRATALAALAEIGGRDALDAHDRALLSRLIAIKQLDERPEPMHLCGSWYALPSCDEAEVFAAFDLSDPVPATMRMGADAWNRDHHSLTHAPHADHRRVYVSPVLDGWRLVFGSPTGDVHPAGGPDDEGDRSLDLDLDDASIKARCAALSAEFGVAHWYGVSCGDGWRAWCIAKNGTVVRYYDTDDADEGERQELDADDTAVDPARLSPLTRKDGSGWLALTECGRIHGDGLGALSI